MIPGEAIVTRSWKLHFRLLITSRLCAFFQTKAAHAWNGRAVSHRKASATRRRLDWSREFLRTDSKLSLSDIARRRAVPLRTGNHGKDLFSLMVKDQSVI